jgi:hypothetical protein
VLPPKRTPSPRLEGRRRVVSPCRSSDKEAKLPSGGKISPSAPSLLHAHRRTVPAGSAEVSFRALAACIYDCGCVKSEGMHAMKRALKHVSNVTWRIPLRGLVLKTSTASLPASRHARSSLISPSIRLPSACLPYLSLLDLRQLPLHRTSTLYSVCLSLPTRMPSPCLAARQGLLRHGGRPSKASSEG